MSSKLPNYYCHRVTAQLQLNNNNNNNYYYLRLIKQIFNAFYRSHVHLICCLSPPGNSVKPTTLSERYKWRRSSLCFLTRSRVILSLKVSVSSKISSQTHLVTIYLDYVYMKLLILKF